MTEDLRAEIVALRRELGRLERAVGMPGTRAAPVTGFRLVDPGDVVQAADHNLTMSQAVSIHASAAARSAAIPAPVTNMLSVLNTAPGQIDYWNGTAWTPLGSWTAYTPVWTAATTNPTLGNGSIVGRYMQLGKTLSLRILLTWGTTTAAGSGTWRFGLPGSLLWGGGTIRNIGIVRFLKDTTAYPGIVEGFPGSGNITAAIVSAGTDQNANDMDNLSGPGGGAGLPALASGVTVDLAITGEVA